MQNFTLISKLLRKMRNKFATLDWNYTTNLQMFLANKFFWVHFFPIISVDLKSASSLHILNTRMEKKLKKFGVIEYIFEYYLTIVECKFCKKWLNQIKNLKKNFKNIIWHLFAWIPSSCEDHCNIVNRQVKSLKNNLHNKTIPSKGESKSVTTHWLQKQPCWRKKTTEKRK